MSSSPEGGRGGRREVEPRIKYTIEDYDGLRILRISGGISNVTRKRLAILLDDFTQRSSVILDMSKVSMVTSSGLSTLVDACGTARSRGRRILLMNTNPDLVRMIERLDLYDHFIFVESVEEGQMKLKYYV